MVEEPHFSKCSESENPGHVKLHGRGSQKILAPNDHSDTEMNIIGQRGHLISRSSIASSYHRVWDQFGEVGRHMAHQFIVETDDRAFRDLEPPSHIRRIERLMTLSAEVFLIAQRMTHKILARAATCIYGTCGHKLIQKRIIQVHPLLLRPVVSEINGVNGPELPIDAQYLQNPESIIHIFRPKSFIINIIDP